MITSVLSVLWNTAHRVTLVFECLHYMSWQERSRLWYSCGKLLHIAGVVLLFRCVLVEGGDMFIEEKQMCSLVKL